MPFCTSADPPPLLGQSDVATAIKTVGGGRRGHVTFESKSERKIVQEFQSEASIDDELFGPLAGSRPREIG